MARILDVKGRRVWDSRGRPTVEAEVVVGRGTTPLAMGRAIAPSGASTGSGEAKALDVDAAARVGAAAIDLDLRHGQRDALVAGEMAPERDLL